MVLMWGYHLQAQVWGGLSSHPTVAAVGQGWFVCLPYMPSAQVFAEVFRVCEEPLTNWLPRMEDVLRFVGSSRHSILKNSHERNPPGYLDPCQFTLLSLLLILWPPGQKRIEHCFGTERTEPPLEAGKAVIVRWL